MLCCSRTAKHATRKGRQDDDCVDVLAVTGLFEHHQLNAGVRTFAGGSLNKTNESSCDLSDGAAIDEPDSDGKL